MNEKLDPFRPRAAAIVLLALATALLLDGCAISPDRRDPFEKFNRGVTRFNEGVDSVVLKPAAIAYREVVPPLARTGVSNFFGNLSDAWSAINSLAQLKVQQAAESTLRFGFNSTFGLLGLLDIAGEMGIDRHREDFGQTLGRWGVPTGPYVVLPLLGPSTVRDATALFLVDYRGDGVSYLDPASTRTGLYVLRTVDVRSNLLRASSVLDEAALDKYSFTRDAYLQRRRAEIDEGGRGADDGATPADANVAPGGAPTGAPAVPPPPPAPADNGTQAPQPVQTR